MNVCAEASFLLRIAVKIVKYIHIIVPILLIILISFDLFKAITGPLDEKSKKEAFNKAIRRLIYAIIVFFIPTIINMVFKSIDSASQDKTGATTTTSTSWMTCWLAEYNK